MPFMMNPRLPTRAWQAMLLWLVAVFFCGCSQKSALLRSEPLALKPGEGLIVASLGVKHPLGNKAPFWANAPAINLVIVPLSDPEQRKLRISTTDSIFIHGAWDQEETVIKQGNGRRMVVAYPAPAGFYTLTEKYAELLSYEKRGFSVTPSKPRTFKVNAGAITYIGNHELEFSTGENIFGVTLPYSGRFNLRDSSIPDLDLLQRIRPELRGLPITNSLQ